VRVSLHHCSGSSIDESDSSGNITDEYVYFGGKRVSHRVVSTNALYFYGEDMLGTSRTIFTSAGVLRYDADFYPFGGERAYTNSCPQNYKFESKERNSETNNDDFGARYYSSSFGRWTSPDWSAVPAPVPYANLSNPQTLNLYAMVSDNTETFADLDGHAIADWEWKDLNVCNTTQAADLRCAAEVANLCGSSPVSAVQSTSTHGQAQAQQINVHANGANPVTGAVDIESGVPNSFTLATSQQLSPGNATLREDLCLGLEECAQIQTSAPLQASVRRDNLGEIA
jgi:RHS repeat-associated protein